MSKPSRNEIERSLQGSAFEAPRRKDRSLELPTKDQSSRRKSRIIGGNLGGVSRKAPKKNYGWWIAASSLIILSGLVFIIPEFMNDAPKIAQEKNAPANNIYTNLNIEENTEGEANTAPDGFTVPNDRDRVAEYRQAEDKLQQLKAFNVKAEAAIAAGNYTKPSENNAIAYYQEMLTIDENNVAATDGINAVLKRLFDTGVKDLKAGKLSSAKKSLLSLSNADNESEEYFDLSEAINNYEAAIAKKQRDSKIEKLLAKAEKAIQRERLATPKNDNASSYFQQILELDPENKKAIDGIDTISQKYADLTEKHITNKDWTKAESNIKNLRIASKDSALASFLDKKLIAAKKQAEQAPNELIATNNGDTSDNNESGLESNVEKGTADTQQVPPTENIQTQTQAQGQESRQIAQAPFSGSARQGAPAPTQDLSVASSSVPARENLATPAPVSDSLNNSLANNQRNSQTNNANNRPNTSPSNQQNQDRKRLNTGLQAYYSGEYVTAFSNLSPLADNNNTRAQIRIGYMYQFGRGVSQNTALGTEYFRKALPDLMNRANSNQPWAQSDLGSLYEDGIIVNQSYSEALNWYRQAAAQNYSGAQTNLGNMYFFGKGVQQNQEEAIKWYRLAALGGDAIAKQNLIQLGAVNF